MSLRNSRNKDAPMKQSREAKGASRREEARRAGVGEGERAMDEIERLVKAHDALVGLLRLECDAALAEVKRLTAERDAAQRREATMADRLRETMLERDAMRTRLAAAERVCETIDETTLLASTSSLRAAHAAWDAAWDEARRG